MEFQVQAKYKMTVDVMMAGTKVYFRCTQSWASRIIPWLGVVLIIISLIVALSGIRAPLDSLVPAELGILLLLIRPYNLWVMRRSLRIHPHKDDDIVMTFSNDDLCY